MVNIGIRRLATEMQVLNPRAKFRRYDYDVFGVIVSNVPASELKLPEGYYFSSKNGITNKHNTEDGMYECFDFDYDPEVFGEEIKKTLWERFLEFVIAF